MQRIGPTPYFHPAGEDGFAAEAPSDHERLFTYMAKVPRAYVHVKFKFRPFALH